MAVMAARSMAKDCSRLWKSWIMARCRTASAEEAAARREERSVKLPGWGVQLRERRVEAEEGVRERAVMVWLWARRWRIRGRPMKPVPPVMKIFMM